MPFLDLTMKSCSSVIVSGVSTGSKINFLNTVEITVLSSNIANFWPDENKENYYLTFVFCSFEKIKFQ